MVLFHLLCRFVMLWLICRHRRKFVNSLSIFFVKAVTVGIKRKEHKEIGQSSLIRNRNQMAVKNIVDKCIFVIFEIIFRFLCYATYIFKSKLIIETLNAFNNYVYYHHLFSLSVKTTMA